MSRLPFDDDPKATKVPKVPSSTFQAFLRCQNPAVPTRTILTVSELNATIRDLLENSLTNVWVEGEISNARVWNTGHMYFTLKDGASQIKAVMFRSAVRYLKFKAEDGLKVVARGKISVYDPKGEYQILCEHLEPKGLGSPAAGVRTAQEEARGRRVVRSGRKRPLPALPAASASSRRSTARRCATSFACGGATRMRTSCFRARVQGEGAGREIAHAIRKVERIEAVDVIIVARGGDSLEDLWAFNEEVLARVIAQSQVPIISGVGHETDFTICDFVADLRAPTPSAAAELVVRRKDEFFAHIDRIGERLDAAMHHRLRRMERACMWSRRVQVTRGSKDDWRCAAAMFPGWRRHCGSGSARASHGAAGATSACGDRSINTIRATGSPRFGRGWCRAMGSCRPRSGAG